MAFPLGTAISAGAGLVQGVIGAFTGGAKDRRNRKFTAEQNQLNRDFTLDMWNKEKEYNDPSAQMARYKQAGLNPHLIYGQSNTTSAPSAPQQTTHQDQHDYGEDVMRATQTYAQQQSLASQLKYQDNQNKVLEADRILKTAQTAATLSGAAKTEFETKLANAMFEDTVKQAGLKTISMSLGNSLTGEDINNRRADTAQKVQNTSNLVELNTKIKQEVENLKSSKKLTDRQVDGISQTIAESVQRIKNMEIQGKGYQIDNAIKNLNYELYKRGQNPSDPVYQRLIGRVFEESGLTDSVIQGVKDYSSWWKNNASKAWNWLTK
ncbi:DNA pilot protein [Flyfo microvirus Tbat1_59]|nr:DNA pilot protein [Flyfo microvirus Tbat1_59]